MNDSNKKQNNPHCCCYYFTIIPVPGSLHNSMMLLGRTSSRTPSRRYANENLQNATTVQHIATQENIPK